MNNIKCKKCNHYMKKGIYLKENLNISKDFLGESKNDIGTVYPNGSAELHTCYKCPNCGHSILIGQEEKTKYNLKYNKIIFTGLACAGKTEAYKYILHLYEKKIIKIQPILIKFAKPHYQILDILYQNKNRLFLQEISDVAKKHFGNDIFVNIFDKNVSKYTPESLLICDDLRYKLEFDYAINNDWLIIFIDANEKIRKKRSDFLKLKWSPSHSSESELSLFKDNCHFHIKNENNIDGLYNQLNTILLN